MSVHARILTAVGVILSNAAFTLAQDVPSQPRRLTDVPIAPNAPAVQPSPTPTVKNPALDPSNLTGRRLLPEGSMVNGLDGALFRTAGNDVIFLPDKVESGKSKSAPAQPFVLVPSQKLAQLESATKTSEQNVRVTLSGQVYVYRNRQYLFLTAYSIKQSEAVVERPPTAAPVPQPSAPTKQEDSSQALDPRVEDLIRELENERGGGRVLDPAPDSARPTDVPPTPVAAEESDGSAERLVAEGTLVNGRRGRLVRVKGAGGRLGFAFDNDPDSPATPPMLFVPCAMLTNMEAAARSHGDELAFTVSGRVLVYEGRNYLLPILHQVRRPTDVKSLQ